ncbi:FxsA family membrane protein [Streptomyces sp. LHD-70]|uniref:FxsA family membrane protein n=1 Tax=Streptomyces sp. LHD-70 TaxID=3072140 RepID=UPI00280C9881|nr:FxsA family membrane protein [Streptomyces sp. LHD-70]MDQ8703374.1 FxsA family membrane protein [Streptomyces sp. LHD-70]
MTTGTPSPPLRPAPRSKLRRYVPLGIAAWMVLEIWLLTQVASAWGGLTVFLLLLAGLVLGGLVIKRAGRRAFKGWSEQLQQVQRGEMPERNPRAGGNALTMVAGLLLMMPGVVSDGVGLVLLLPPVRSVLTKRVERSMESRMSKAGPGTFENAFQQARIHRPDGKVVQGEVIRDDAPSAPSAPDEARDQGPRPPLTG